MASNKHLRKHVIGLIQLGLKWLSGTSNVSQEEIEILKEVLEDLKKVNTLCRWCTSWPSHWEELPLRQTWETKSQTISDCGMDKPGTFSILFPKYPRLHFTATMKTSTASII